MLYAFSVRPICLSQWFFFCMCKFSLIGLVSLLFLFISFIKMLPQSLICFCRTEISIFPLWLLLFYFFPLWAPVCWILICVKLFYNPKHSQEAICSVSLLLIKIWDFSGQFSTYLKFRFPGWAQGQHLHCPKSSPLFPVFHFRRACHFILCPFPCLIATVDFLFFHWFSFFC